MESSQLFPRLVAILAGDAVGYSQHMAVDDQATIRALDSARDVFRHHTVTSGGRVVDTAGDSVLAVFGTAVGAASAALAIQSQLQGARDRVGPERHLQFRIGLHLGDVVEKADGSVYGHGVNVASRLQAVADPGGIVASESLRLAVQAKLGVDFEHLGTHTFKNVVEPVGVHRIVLGSEGRAPAARPRSPPSPPHLLSILVLPFANQTGDERRSYVADALTASITSDLTRLPDVFVVPATTAFTFQGRTLTLPKLAQEAGVRFVLQGTVLASGDRLRIAAQLADASSSTHLWNETFDGDLNDLFWLMDKVTTRVGNSIGTPMAIAAARTIDTQRTNAAVGDLLLRALALTVQTQSIERFAQIESLYRQALAQDAGNQSAMTGLAANLAVHASWLEDTDQAKDEKLLEARDLALAVKAVDPSNLGLYLPLVLYALHVNDFDSARRTLEAALTHNPKHPGVYLNFAVFHLEVGEPLRAIPLLERSLELRPKGSANVFAALGFARLALGEHDAAIEWLLKALDLQFHNLDIFSNLAMAYARRGDMKQAAAYADDYRRRAATSGYKGAKHNPPRPGSAPAYVAYYHERLLPDWRRAGLP